VTPVTKDAEPATQPLEGRTIAVLSSLLAGTYFGRLIAAVAEAVHHMGGKTLAVQTQNASWVDPYRTGPGKVPHVALDKVDGYVVIINSVPAEQLAELRAAGKPVVMISHEEASFPCPVVKPDNSIGVREAIEHLIGHGHTRIAFVGDTTQLDIAERYESYRLTLSDHGIEPDEALFFKTTDNQDNGGRNAGLAMIAAGLPSTAVLTGTDYNATGVMAALREAGYAIPRDQAVVSFDDMPGAELNSPALSSVSLNFTGVGTECVNLLARLLDGQEVAPGHYPVKTNFVPRHSCGCLGRSERLAALAVDISPEAEFLGRVQGALNAAPAAGRVATTPSLSGLRGRPLSLAASRRTELAMPGSQDAARGVAAKLAGFFTKAVNEDLEDVELLELNQLAEALYGLGASP
jgi:DNA-binding LacI/PurR family transcriptional regulator